MAQRILVADDDAFIQDLFATALREGGYDVEVAEDGLSAIEKLRTGHFDLALMDYHMPDLDGLGAARVVGRTFADEVQTPVLAVTADAEGLRSSSHEGVFVDVLAKPIEMSALLAAVAERLRAASENPVLVASRAHWLEAGLADRPSALVLPTPSAREASLLRPYFDLSGVREPDLIVLARPSGVTELERSRVATSLFVLPVVDLTGLYAKQADASFKGPDLESWRALALTVNAFASARAQLSGAARGTSSLSERLLAYAYARGHELVPIQNPSNPDCVTYPGFFPAVEAVRALEELTRDGLMRRRFADRMHACPSCSSRRLNVREECPSCRSPELDEAVLLHHFRCAYQGPQAEFERDDRLVCPKCKSELRHYGSDYDKPGHVLACHGCNALTGEPAIGFTCLDCCAHADGEAVPRVDVFSYALTDAGVSRVTEPRQELLLPGSDMSVA